MEVTEFQGTTSEVIFLKLILANSPSLSKMIVGSYDELDVGEVRGFYEQLRMSVSASPRVELVVIPYDHDI